MKKIYLLIILIAIALTNCTHTETEKVYLIINPPYSIQDDTENIAYTLMTDTFKKIGIAIEIEYVTLPQAMQMIEDETDAIFFPYIKPRNMSNQIITSDTLYIISHKIFYDNRKFEDRIVNSLVDLKPNIVGTYPYYEQEIALRRAGLIVHYSQDNTHSFQKLIEGEVDFVIEDQIKAQLYLKDIEHEDKEYIKYKEIDLFPTPFVAIASIKSEKAKKLIEAINETM